jgi:adenylosuccinate synthase
VLESERATDTGAGGSTNGKGRCPAETLCSKYARGLDEAFYRGKRALLEGTQGTGLSIYHGEYPYVTSRDTTVSGCLAESGIARTASEEL